MEEFLRKIGGNNEEINYYQFCVLLDAGTGGNPSRVSSYLSQNKGSSFMRFSYFVNNMDKLQFNWEKSLPNSSLSIIRKYKWRRCNNKCFEFFIPLIFIFQEILKHIFHNMSNAVKLIIHIFKSLLFHSIIALNQIS